MSDHSKHKCIYNTPLATGGIEVDDDGSVLIMDLIISLPRRKPSTAQRSCARQVSCDPVGVTPAVPFYTRRYFGRSCSSTAFITRAEKKLMVK